MFEAISYSTPKVNGNDIAAINVIPIQDPEKTSVEQSDGLLKPPESDRVAKQAENEEKSRQAEQRPHVTKKLLKELEQDIEAIHSVGLQFSVHDKTGRTFVKIMDKATDKLIREIPSEEVLNLAAKMDEMIGILFDKKV
jgi:flagellar protein FlaG